MYKGVYKDLRNELYAVHLYSIYRELGTLFVCIM